jgi:hypothetical protein
MSNSRRHLHDIIDLRIAAPISAPTNVRLENMTQYAVTITWNGVACSDRGAAFDHYEVRLDGIDSRSDIIITYVTSTTASLQLLTPYTLFATRVRYVNAVGPGPFSVEYRFRTPATGKQFL